MHKIVMHMVLNDPEITLCLSLCQPNPTDFEKSSPFVFRVYNKNEFYCMGKYYPSLPNVSLQMGSLRKDLFACLYYPPLTEEVMCTRV